MLKLLILLFIVTVNIITANDEFLRKTEEINKSQNLWKAAPNKITHKGIKYMRKLAGTKIDSILLPVKKSTVFRNDIPENFDARAQWTNCKSTISKIRNQGHCGSCWAVAAASTMTDRLCIKNNGTTNYTISAQNLVSCCSNCSPSGGCNGGFHDRAWLYFQNNGIVTGGDYNSEEGCQPYHISPTSAYRRKIYTPTCYNSCTNRRYSIPYNSDKHYGATTYGVPQDEAMIQSEIMTNGPVEAAFYVYTDFYYYKSGIYRYKTGRMVGGHAVRVLGWGVENEVKYWLAANSWGSRWGESGTFKIIRGTNECSFESYIVAGLIKN
ncbi:cathepsin B-like cysteine proteinase 4 [Lycorma delicatula]|uniref:cathepsin B-like cysteine proteinase 4 n=1 Tax=Lycorma delicatula TaxID=130591 RepID=UPI003F50EC68